MIIHETEPLAAAHDKIVIWSDGRSGLHGVAFGGYETRQQSVLRLLEGAERLRPVDALGPLVIHTNDQPVSSEKDGFRSYAFCTAAGFVDVAVPDFVFCRWPEVGIDDYDDTCRALAEAGAQPAELDLVGWIGNTLSHPVRGVLHQLGQDHPDLLDIQGVDWVRVPTRLLLDSAAGNALSMPEQAQRWSGLIDVEGGAYSGRLKMLLHSGRPVLIQDRPWHEWFWDQLVPWENHIPVRRDLSDLLERARWVQDYPAEAAQIGRAGQELAQRLLTRSSAVKQWARTLADAARHPAEAWAPPHLAAVLSPILSDMGAPTSVPSA
jgi:Glycosyl transferase family 90